MSGFVACWRPREQPRPVLALLEEGRRPHAGGGLVVVADARIDARDALLGELGDCPRRASPEALIAAAYRRWGTDCLDHLVGSFSFALWDDERGRLLIARDHLGTRPCYVAHARAATFASTSIDALRDLPEVDTAIRPDVVADLLVFGRDRDVHRTVHAGIDRLPPASAVVVTATGLDRRTYWRPGPREPRAEKRDEWLDRLLACLRVAVADRAPDGGRASILLSGGIDSALVATLAVEAGCELDAHTLAYATIVPHRERELARRVSRRLSIRQSTHLLDEYRLFERARRAAGPIPLPISLPLRASELDALDAVSTDTLFTGQGGDELFPLFGVRSPAERVRDAARRYGWGLIVEPGWALQLAAARSVEARRRPLRPSVPAWIKADLRRATDLDASVEAEAAERARRMRATARDKVVLALSSPQLSAAFDLDHPTVTGRSASYQYPLLDVRVVEEVLRAPDASWLHDKHALRLLLRGRLPRTIVNRPKTPMRVDVLPRHLRANGAVMASEGAELDPYIDRSLLPSLGEAAASGQLWQRLAVTALSSWLVEEVG